MNNLKTLNEIDLKGCPNEAFMKARLRLEVKKWYHRSDGNKHKFIKEFFNLTDDTINVEDVA